MIEHADIELISGTPTRGVIAPSTSENKPNFAIVLPLLSTFLPPFPGVQQVSDHNLKLWRVEKNPTSLLILLKINYTEMI